MLSACHCRSITSNIRSTLRHCETPLRRVWSSCPSRSWPPRSWTTAVDGSEILYQWRLVVYPSIHKALSISNGAGFLPSTVWKTWNSNRFTTCSNNNQLWLIARFYPMLPNFALDVMQKKTGATVFVPCHGDSETSPNFGNIVSAASLSSAQISAWRPVDVRQVSWCNFVDLKRWEPQCNSTHQKVDCFQTWLTNVHKFKLWRLYMILSTSA